MQLSEPSKSKNLQFSYFDSAIQFYESCFHKRGWRFSQVINLFLLISLETDLSCEDLFDLPHCLSLAFYNQISSTPFRILLTNSGQDFQGINQADFQGMELHFTSFCSYLAHAFLSTSDFKSLFKLYKGSKLCIE